MKPQIFHSLLIDFPIDLSERVYFAAMGSVNELWTIQQYFLVGQYFPTSTGSPDISWKLVFNASPGFIGKVK